MRLTKKRAKDYFGCKYDMNYSNEDLMHLDMLCKNKLGQLEDIEEELGIDLITLFKALKQGHIWVKNEELKQKIWHCCYYQLGATGSDFYFYCQYGCMDTSYDFFKIKDYGKTWALTKEELNNE